MMVADGAGYGPMDLVSNEEDDPIALLKGKKRQRIVESSRVPLDAIVGPGLLDVSASSGDQICNTPYPYSLMEQSMRYY